MTSQNPYYTDTVCAVATPAGMGAIAVVRISGPRAIEISDKIFNAKVDKKLKEAASHTIHFGIVKDGTKIVDEVLASVFKAPHSYTGEDTVEISCHGSPYIQQQVIHLFLENGARPAQPGEFTLRAFLNGKLDLSQAEAVADLIASDSAAAHKVAIQQMRGGFSKKIKELREQLVHFASLIELELDFAEEDVEFANREELTNLVKQLQKAITHLADSFRQGHVIKNGVPVAIVGEPNVGKSTLLNALLDEERAIVSEIAGTTRDTIEEEISIDGINFRFIDTAGLRETTDTIESIGISKTHEKIKQADVVIYLFDAASPVEKIKKALDELRLKLQSDKLLIPVANKSDKAGVEELKAKFADITNVVFISALKEENLDALREKLLSYVNTGALKNNEMIVTNARHHEALLHTSKALDSVLTGIESGLSGDLLAIDIRRALHYLGEITGQITTDDLLGNIFSKFCIGK